MNTNFSLVPYGSLTETLPLLLKYLSKSELWTTGRAKIDDIVAFLYTGQMQLWIVYDENNRVFGHVITEEKQYPRCRMLVLQYIAAESHFMKYVDEKVFSVLENYAKDAGCHGIEAFGRIGWKPHMLKHGYSARTMVFEKYFTGE